MLNGWWCSLVIVVQIWFMCNGVTNPNISSWKTSTESTTSIGNKGGRGKGGKKRKPFNSPTNWLIPGILPLGFHSFILGFWPHEPIWFCTQLSLKRHARSESHFLFKFWRKRTGEHDRYMKGGKKQEKRVSMQLGQALHASQVLWPPTTGSKLETNILLILRWES